ncbi:TetR/AcrR family transcriptional regulator [Actinomycetospora cinnamomea]|uniref:TetR family transcriptional regulator n=1 Tax=Actinomycetospora cinnamomea TaxID=663609 RepID=A0A2U1EU35_9PSEU|nr:TetR/AcrR family transcriptional regulator [Actinomycetospora cinnamomea]PVZ03427.1 TetR family transcriptional regulator [Actinomycetospora cinnamomea]
MAERRRYDTSSREHQAALTRRQIARVAVAQFVERGYATTSVASIARAAGVSAQTVYNGFGTKAALLKEGYDLALAGDDADVPLAERPEVRALYAEPEPAAFLHGYARLGRALLDRMGALAVQIGAGALAGDPDLVELRATTDQERLVGTGMVVRRLVELGALSPGLDQDVARDRLWALNSTELWHLLTVTRGWSGEQYEQWVGQAMCDAVLPVERREPPAPPV